MHPFLTSFRRRPAPRAALLVAVIALGAMAGCAVVRPLDSPTPGPTSGATSGETPSDRPVRSTPPVATVAPESASPMTGEVPSDLLDEILASAAEETGVSASEIEVVQAEAVTWPDGSLGCPEPGMFYTQALIDGYHVLLDADGSELDYRVGNGGTFRLCEGNGRPAGP